MEAHIPTDNVYSVNRRARTSQQNLELFEANIYHERKLRMQGYSKGLGKARRSETLYSPANLIGDSKTNSKHNIHSCWGNLINPFLVV